MSIVTRTELNERLKKSIIQVHFTKVNGEHRIMRCTLNPNLISECPGDEPNGPKLPEDSGRMNVWDTDKQDWRAFLIENITTVITPALANGQFNPNAEIKTPNIKSTVLSSVKSATLSPVDFTSIAFDPKVR
jgi:hypothetical protein